MNQKHTDQMKAAVRKRRGYVFRMGWIVILLGLSAVLSGISCQLAIVVGLLGQGWIPRTNLAQYVVFRILWTVIPAMVALVSLVSVRRGATASKLIEYVPPAAQQL